MSFWEPGMDSFPHQTTGVLKRTSGVMKEGDEDVVFIHIEHVTQGRFSTTREELPLVFKVTRAISLEALMASPGDVVFVEWIPTQCSHPENVGAGVVGNATRFHLGRNVAAGFGDGFTKPKWFV